MQTEHFAAISALEEILVYRPDLGVYNRVSGTRSFKQKHDLLSDYLMMKESRNLLRLGELCYWLLMLYTNSF